MRNILYISPSAGIGGTETFLKHTLLYSDPTRFQNHYLLFDRGPLYDFLKKNGAHLHLLQPRPRLSKISDWLRVQNKMRAIIKTKKIEIVHSSMSYAALFAARPCRQMKCPHIWFQHGPTTGWMDQLAGWLNHQGLISNSNYTEATQLLLENKFSFLTKKNRKRLILPLGTEIKDRDKNEDLLFKKKICTKYGINQDQYIVSMLCRIQPWKGVHLLVEACEKIILSKAKINFHVIIWGEAFKGDTYLQNLMKRCEANQLPITFAGLSQNPNQALAISDLLINASIEPEPFGLSIIEAMSVGTVALVPDEGGPSEIIKDYGNGLVFQARDATSLSAKILEFLNDKELQKKLATHSLQSAQNDFNVKKMMTKMEDFYRQF